MMKKFKQGDVIIINTGNLRLPGIILPKGNRFLIRFNRRFVKSSILFLRQPIYSRFTIATPVGSNDLLTYINML